ncbi:MAG: hypothetical protein ACR2KJ_00920 [Jatrophihabitans sp.]
MAQHSRRAVRFDGRARSAGLGALVWIAGLAAGLYAVLTLAAHVNCSSGAHGTVCRPQGTWLGAGLVVAVIVTVGVASVLVRDARSARGVLLRLLIALVVLAVISVGSYALIATS